MMTRARIVEVKFAKRINDKPEKVFRLLKASEGQVCLVARRQELVSLCHIEYRCGIIRHMIGYRFGKSSQRCGSK